MGGRSLNGSVLGHKNSDFRYILVAERATIYGGMCCRSDVKMHNS